MSEKRTISREKSCKKKYFSIFALFKVPKSGERAQNARRKHLF